MSKLLLIVLALSLFLIGCGDSGYSSVVKGTKSTKGSSQKVVSEKVQQEALKAGTLLELQPQSLRITEITNTEVKLGLQFLLNQQNNIGFRRYNFNIQKGEVLTLDNSQFDLTADSRLKIELYRFKSAQDKDHLSVHFQFENRTISDNNGESSLVLLLELSKNTKTPAKINFYYPTPENFDLKKWSENLVKDTLTQ